MKNETIRKNINVDKPNFSPIFNLKENDNTILRLALFKNATEFDITGQTVKLGAKVGKVLIEQTTGFIINKNNLDIELKNSIVQPGTIEIDLEIKDASGSMTTASFFIVASSKVLNDKAVEATNEFDIFTKTVDKVEKDYDSLRKIIIDENQAANLQDQVNQTNAHLETNTNKLDYFVRPEQFKKETDVDDTDSILEALSTSKKVIFDNKVYRVNKRLVLNGHTLLGCGDGDIRGNDCRIEFYDMPEVESCVHCTGMTLLENIKFQYAEWKSTTPNICGLTGERKIVARNCAFISFPKNGLLLYRKESTPLDKTPYASSFENCVVAYSKEHNIIIGNGGNAINLYNTKSWYAGTSTYMQKPTVVGGYDGLYIDGKISYLPSALNLEPQQITIMSGDYSYNSRYGINYRHCNDTTQLGGYMEYNLGESEINIDRSYGLYILNPLCHESKPKVTTPETSDESNGNIYDYPNTVIIRGKNIGKGDKITTNFPSVYGNNGAVFGLNKGGDGFDAYARYGGEHNFKIGDNMTLLGKSVQIGTDTVDTTHNGVRIVCKEGVGSPQIVSEKTDEGSRILNVVSNFKDSSKSRYTILYNAQGDYASDQPGAMSLSANSSNKRSINCGGTVNTSGADYAEYMVKTSECGVINKGDICGIDTNGELTDIYDKSISFVIKSTNPSFVGGDDWDQNKIPREMVDRIAFCGQVPVNILAPIGSYIVPINDNGKIGVGYVETPTFEEYKNCLGKVIKIENRKSVVIVKTI